MQHDYCDEINMIKLTCNRKVMGSNSTVGKNFLFYNYCLLCFPRSSTKLI